ncbi:MAG: hypothetical protein R6V00_01605 [Candidatus Aminicenantes bacterium]
MKKIFRLFFLIMLTSFLILVIGGPSFAQSDEDISQKDGNSVSPKNTMAGITMGSFSIASDRFKEIFMNPSTVTGIEASYLFPIKSHFLGLTLEVRGLSQAGHSTVTNRNIYFSLTPLTLTGKYMALLSDFTPYFGAGIDLFFYKEESHISLISGITPGLHIEGGVYYKPPLFEFIKIRAVLRISRAFANENDIKVNLGGLEFGLGILYCFNI